MPGAVAMKRRVEIMELPSISHLVEPLQLLADFAATQGPEAAPNTKTQRSILASVS